MEDDRLAAAAEGWDALLAEQPCPDATRSAGWLRAWWAEYGAPRRARRPVVILAEEDGRLVGAAPMMLERLPGGPTIARHLGRSSHWFDPTPLAAPGRADVLTALGEAIASLPADLIVLEDLVAGSPELDALAAGMEGAHVEDQDERRHRYRVDDPPRLRRRRKEVRRLARRAAESGTELLVDVTAGRAAALQLADEASVLVDRTWSGRGDASDITGERGRRYLRAALLSLPEDGATTATVRADGRLVAFDLAVHVGDMAAVFRGSWDRSSGIAGAGWMSMLALIDDLERRGLAEIDFGKFDWPYKQHLTSLPADRLVTLQLANGARGALARLAWSTRPRLLRARHRVAAGIMRQVRATGALALSGPWAALEALAAI